MPNGPGRQFTYNGAPLVQKTDEFLVKSDYNLGKHHISGHYFQIKYSVPIAIPPADNILQINTNPAAAIELKNVSVVDLYTINDRFFLNSYYGYTSQNGDSLSNIPFNMSDAGVNIAQPAGLPGGKGPGMDINVSGGLGISGSHFGQFNRGDQSLREIGTLVKGNHAIQFGGQFLRIRVPMANQYEQDGVFGFSNSLSGDNTADFLLGAISGFTQGGGLFLNFTGINWSLFVQDDWRATPHLTISAGLRWDPSSPIKTAWAALPVSSPAHSPPASPILPRASCLAAAIMMRVARSLPFSTTR